jgi:hypothetical protein
MCTHKNMTAIEGLSGGGEGDRGEGKRMVEENNAKIHINI